MADLTDTALERALGDLELRSDLTPHAKAVLCAITEADCQSDRARFLLAAANDWDQAGYGAHGERRISAREHERLWMRLGAALIDQLIADRRRDPALLVELEASVAPTSMAALGVSRG